MTDPEQWISLYLSIFGDISQAHFGWLPTRDSDGLLLKNGNTILQEVILMLMTGMIGWAPN